MDRGFYYQHQLFFCVWFRRCGGKILNDLAPLHLGPLFWVFRTQTLRMDSPTGADLLISPYSNKSQFNCILLLWPPSPFPSRGIPPPRPRSFHSQLHWLVRRVFCVYVVRTFTYVYRRVVVSKPRLNESHFSPFKYFKSIDLGEESCLTIVSYTSKRRGNSVDNLRESPLSQSGMQDVFRPTQSRATRGSAFSLVTMKFCDAEIIIKK